MLKFFVVTVGAWLFAGGFYFASAQTKPPAKPKSSSTIPAATMARGKTVYENECLSCHQVNGQGVQRMNPPLVKTKYVLGDKKTIITIVVQGLDKPIDINGDTYENVMPAHPDLTDQQIADVLTYVRNSFGNKASAISAADVKSVKSKIK